MMKIFAGIRRMLASSRAARGLGEIAAGVVRDVFVPKMESLVDRERNPEERSRLAILLEEYKLYTRKGTPEYRDLEDTAEAAVSSAVKRHNLTEDWEDELAQMVAQDFYKPIGWLKDEKGGFGRTEKQTGDSSKILINDLKKFEPENQKRAYDFTRYFLKVLKDRLSWRFREMKRRTPDVFKKSEPETEEGGKLDPFGKIPARGDAISEAESYKDIDRSLAKFIDERAEDEISRALYHEWRDVLEKKNGGPIEMQYDVYPQLLSKYKTSRSSLHEKHKKLIKLVDRFFGEELGIRLTNKLKNKLRISSVEVVTMELFRQRFAAWMLGV